MRSALSVEAFAASLDTRDIVLKYAVIIGLGLAIFEIDDRELVAPSATTALILLLVAGKTAFFVGQSLKKILQAIDRNVPYFRFLIFMTVNVLTVTASFGVDYFCLYRVDAGHFSGLPEDVSVGRAAFEFGYLSMLAFNNLGFYDVVPTSVAAKSVVMVETLLYYFSIVLVLSDFVSLRDSVLEDRQASRPDAPAQESAASARR